MTRILVAATVALVTSFVSAKATPTYYYETDSATPAAPGTIASGGSGTGGGLCVPGVGACPSLGFGQTAGPLTSNGYISMSGTTSGLGNYLLSINITGVGSQSYGSIWDVTLINGGSSYSLATTPIVAQTAANTPYNISVNVAGTGTFTIGITDLLEQYVGQQDTLPGYLGNPADNSISGTTVTSTSSFFTVSYAVTAVPEPASISILMGSFAVLGVLRRRRFA